MQSWRLAIALSVVIVLAGCQSGDGLQSAISSVGDVFKTETKAKVGSSPNSQSAAANVGPPVTASANLTSVAGTVSPAAVIDGDTIELAGRRIRLFGIDAPETSQPCTIANETIACGLMATNVLIGFTTAATVKCDREDTDRYGRDVSRCFADGQDLSAAMVRAGFAVAYRKYSQSYVSDEEAAKAQKLGIWKGTFVMPWDWRAGRRQ